MNKKLVLSVAGTAALSLLISACGTPASNAPANKPANAPVANAPVANAPVANAPVANAPVANAPVANAPVANKPTELKPVANTTKEAEMHKDGEPKKDDKMADHKDGMANAAHKDDKMAPPAPANK